MFTVHVKQQYNKSKPKFAEETGFVENFILRLKEDAVPSIFVDAEGREKRPAERRSASAILEKKITCKL